MRAEKGSKKKFLTRSGKEAVLCGGMSLDLISKPPEKGAPVSFTVRPGGSVLNTALLTRRMGVPCTLMGRLGTDFLSEALLSVLRSEHVNSRHVQQDELLKPGLAFAQVARNGESSYVFYSPSGKSTAFGWQYPPNDLFDNAFAFHSSSLYSYADHSFDNILRSMEKAREKGIVTIYDPNWRVNRIPDKAKARHRIMRLLELADIPKMSVSDLQGITGEQDVERALRMLPGNSFVTAGEQGSFFYEHRTGRKVRSAAFKVPVSDTIGAGDAFTAGLITCLAEKGLEGSLDTLPETLAFAQATAAMVCMGPGATSSLRTRDQVLELLARGS